MPFDADDDDFYTSDDDLAIDNDPGLVGEAKSSLLAAIERTVNSMKKNVQFNETGDFTANLNLLSSYISHLIDINNIDDEDFSDEELMSKLDEIMKATTVLTMSNIDTILPDEEEPQALSDSKTDDTGTDW